MTLAGHLSTLEASGLIRLAQVQPEIEYLFRHSLVQEAAYGSLVKNDRKRLHLAAGEALERLYPQRLESLELAPRLADHFCEAGDDARALSYSTLAGDAAFRQYANAEAAEHYKRALDAAVRLSAPGDQVIRLYLCRGRALELSAQYEQALSNYDEMQALAAGRADRAMELASLMARATLRATVNPVTDPAQAQSLSQEALGLARELGDRAAESKILWNLMLNNLFTSPDPQQAIAYGEQSLSLARELGLREQLAFTLNDLAKGYLFSLQLTRALEPLEEARELWQELGNLPMLAENISVFASHHRYAGNYDQAIRASEESLRISQSIHNLFGQAQSRMMIQEVYLEIGQPDKALEVIAETIRLANLSGHLGAVFISQTSMAWVYGTLGAIGQAVELIQQLIASSAGSVTVYSAMWLAILARLHLLAGDTEQAAAAMEEIYRQPTTKGIGFWTFSVALAEGELAFSNGDHLGAITAMDELLVLLRSRGCRAYIPEALSIKGRAVLAQVRLDEAHEILAEARAEAEAQGARRILWLILATQGEIESQRGNLAEAQAVRLEAREIVQYIADHAPPELRDSFLARPEVRDVMRET